MAKRPVQHSRSKSRVVKPAAIEVKQSKREFYLTKLTAEHLAKISYVAARGVSDEQGAVQRILNPRRINSLKEYALSGGDYPACIVLNWVNDQRPLRYSDGNLTLAVESRSAQVIDGQHRVEGLREAIAESDDVKRVEIPVAIYKSLGTRDCADIFLSINTEQKPVPKSLVYDLYGLASDYIVDYAASRAKDIATELHENEESPYFGLIKFPGDTKKGGVALSTVVAALKPFVAKKGTFEQEGIFGLEEQSAVVLNYFTALRELYGSHWEDKDNAFAYAAGFSGAVDFLKSHLFEYCVRRKSFTSQDIKDVLEITPDTRILQSEIRGLGGAGARRAIADRLVELFDPQAESEQSFKY